MLMRIMLVDSDPGTLRRSKRMPVWAENGFELSSQVSTGAEAIRSIRVQGARVPDLVLIYNKPPLIDPPELIRELAGLGCAVIVISPRDDSENMRECFLLGAIDYLTEPVSEGRIRSALVRAEEQLKKNTVGREYQLAAEEYFSRVFQGRQEEKFCRKLRQFILESEGRTVTTENAADYFGFNKDYFGRLFKQEFGMTFGELYKQFRILYAQKLLATGRYKVYEVSELLGFSSVDYFTSVFKRVTGRRPSELKKL